MDLLRTLKAVGQPLKRKEDFRLLTGKGRFTDDFAMPGQTWAAMVRSPYPHARIISIDKEVALAMPGVLGVWSGADAAADGQVRVTGRCSQRQPRRSQALAGADQRVAGSEIQAAAAD